MPLRLYTVESTPPSDDCLVWEAELGQERAGWAEVHLRLNPALPWVLDDDTILFQSGVNAYLEHLFVEESFRRKGVARALLQALEAAVREHVWHPESPMPVCHKEVYSAV